MASTLTTPVTVNVAPSLVADLGTFAPQLAAFGLTFASGTSADQADRLYVARRTASTGGDSIDLSGSLLQPDQSSFVIAKLVLLLVINRDSSINITVGGGSNAAIVVGNPIGPGDFDLIVRRSTAGAIAVANGSTDIIKVVSASGTPSYDVLILGRSA